MPVRPTLESSSFEQDLRDRHLIYEYNVSDSQGNPEKWRYETWFFNEHRVVYAIHGGPMPDRKSFQTANYQCIRPGEFWQCNWLEETGTDVSMVFDIPRNQITTLIVFSKGHWDHNEAALGDKRNQEDLERWRSLAQIGTQVDRKILCEQATLLESFRGSGDLEGIEMDWATL